MASKSPLWASSLGGKPLYKHRKDLFISQGMPMKFRMIPSSERRKIKGSIEHGGGIVSSVFSEGCIRLAPPGSILTTEDTISTEFIIQCVAANKLLDKEKFKLASSKPVEQDKEPYDFDRISSQGKTRTQRKIWYTKEEDNGILKYLERHNKFCEVKGNVVFKEMEFKKVTSHPWQSMKNRLLRNIVNQLENYNSVSENFKKNLADYLDIRYTVNKNRILNVPPSTQSKFKSGGQNATQSSISDSTVQLEVLKITSQKPNNPQIAAQNVNSSQTIAVHDSSSDLLENLSLRRLTRSGSMSMINDKRKAEETENIVLRSRKVVPSNNVSQKFINDSQTTLECSTNSGLRQRASANPEPHANSVKISTSKKRHPAPEMLKSKRMKQKKRNSPLRYLSDSSNSYPKTDSSIDSSASNSSAGKPHPKKLRLGRMDSTDSSNSDGDDCERRITRASQQQKRNHPSKVANIVDSSKRVDVLSKLPRQMCRSNDHTPQDSIRKEKTSSLKKNGATKKDEHEIHKTYNTRTKRKSEMSYYESSADSAESSPGSEPGTNTRRVQKTEYNRCAGKVEHRLMQKRLEAAYNPVQKSLEAVFSPARKELEAAYSPALKKHGSQMVSSGSDSDISSAATIISPYNQACHLASLMANRVYSHSSPNEAVPKQSDYANTDDDTKRLVVPEKCTSNGRIHVQEVKKLTRAKRSLVLLSVSDETTDHSSPLKCSKKHQDIVEENLVVNEVRELPCAPASVKDVLTHGLEITESETDYHSEFEPNLGTGHHFGVPADARKKEALGINVEDDNEPHQMPHLQISRHSVLTVPDEIPKSVPLSNNDSVHVLCPDAYRDFINGLMNKSPVEIIELSRSSDPEDNLAPQNGYQIKLKTPPSSVAEFELLQPGLPNEEARDSQLDGFTMDYLSVHFRGHEMQVAQTSNYTISDVFQDVDNLSLSSSDMPPNLVEATIIQKSCAIQTEVIPGIYVDCAVQTDATKADCSKSVAIQTEILAVAREDRTVQMGPTKSTVGIQTEAIADVYEDCTVQTDPTKANVGIQTEIVIAVCENRAAQMDPTTTTVGIQTEVIAAVYEDCAVQTDTSKADCGTSSESPSLESEPLTFSAGLLTTQDDSSCDTVIFDGHKMQEGGLFDLRNALAQRVIENAIQEVASGSSKPNFNNSVIICKWLSTCLKIPVEDLQKLLQPSENEKQNTSEIKVQNPRNQGTESR